MQRSPTPLADSNGNEPYTIAKDSRLDHLGFLRAPVWIFDVDNLCIAWANKSGLDFWKAKSLEDLKSRDMSEGMSASVHQRLLQYQNDCNSNNQSFDEHWTVYPNDKPQTAEVVFSPYTLEDGRAALMIHLLYENDEADSDTLHSTQALMHTSAMISLYGSDWQLIYSNPAARSVAAREQMSLHEQLVNRSDIEIIKQELEETGTSDMECLVCTSSGLAWHSMNFQISPDPVTGDYSILVSCIDVTAKRLAQQEALRQAQTDSLTGLPNRVALMQSIEEQIEESNKGITQFAILLLDLDRFKLVNDSLGHALGDQLLQAFATRLVSLVPEPNLVARLGGDEFVVLLKHVDNRDQIVDFTDILLTKLNDPIEFSEHKLRITPSVGICTYPKDGFSTTELMQHADIAMDAAKTLNDGYRFFEPRMDRISKDRLTLETDLANAIEKNEFELHYQAKIAAATGEVTGVEALVRWKHPTRGRISPIEFITIAEETGMIVPVGRWVMKQAMLDQANWQAQGYDVPVSINISPKQFLSVNFVDHVKQVMKEAGTKPGMIDFEITESVLIVDQDEVLNIMHELNEHGVAFSLDDFGTGYSNLAYLQKYPLDALKIDRSFLRDMNDTALLELVLGMGKIMGLRVVAEGVETIQQINWLRAHECDELQGFFFSKPVRHDTWLEFLKAHTPMDFDANFETNKAA